MVLAVVLGLGAVGGVVAIGGVLLKIARSRKLIGIALLRASDALLGARKLARLRVGEDCDALGIHAVALRGEIREDLSFSRLLEDCIHRCTILAYSGNVLMANKDAIRRKLAKDVSIDVILPHPKVVPVVTPYEIAYDEYRLSWTSTIRLVQELRKEDAEHFRFYATRVFPSFGVSMADNRAAHVQHLSLGTAVDSRLLFRVEEGQLLNTYQIALARHMGQSDSGGKREWEVTDDRDLEDLISAVQDQDRA